MNRRQAKKDFRNRTQADFDSTVFKAGYYAAVMEVLEIIDKHGQNLVGMVMEERFAEIDAMSTLASVRAEVQALQEDCEDATV